LYLDLEFSQPLKGIVTGREGDIYGYTRQALSSLSCAYELVTKMKINLEINFFLLNTKMAQNINNLLSIK